MSEFDLWSEDLTMPDASNYEGGEYSDEFMKDINDHYRNSNLYGYGGEYGESDFFKYPESNNTNQVEPPNRTVDVPSWMQVMMPGPGTFKHTPGAGVIPTIGQKRKVWYGPK